MRTNLAFVGDAVLQIWGRCLGGRGTAPFLKSVIFAHSAFQKGTRREGGTWGNLAHRRAAAGAVGNTLDVGDESVTTIGVTERSRLFLETLRGCVELLRLWKVFEDAGLRARWEGRISPTLAHVGQGRICFQTFYFNVSPEFLQF